MTSAIVVSSSAAGATALAADLEAVGIRTAGVTTHGNLVQEVVRHAPDLVVCHEGQPDGRTFSRARSCWRRPRRGR